jgi:hypothetical protein
MGHLVFPLTLTPKKRASEPRFVNRKASAFTNGLDFHPIRAGKKVVQKKLLTLNDF